METTKRTTQHHLLCQPTFLFSLSLCSIFVGRSSCKCSTPLQMRRATIGEQTHCCTHCCNATLLYHCTAAYTVIHCTAAYTVIHYTAAYTALLHTLRCCTHCTAASNPLAPLALKLVVVQVPSDKTVYTKLLGHDSTDFDLVLTLGTTDTSTSRQLADLARQSADARCVLLADGQCVACVVYIVMLVPHIQKSPQTGRILVSRNNFIRRRTEVDTA